MYLIYRYARQSLPHVTSVTWGCTIIIIYYLYMFKIDISKSRANIP